MDTNKIKIHFFSLINGLKVLESNFRDARFSNEWETNRGTSSRGGRISESGRNAAGGGRNQGQDETRKISPLLSKEDKKAPAKKKPHSLAGQWHEGTYPRTKR